jgi:ribose-phosphate pyrophosphokinase
MTAAIFAFAEGLAVANALATELGVPCSRIEVRQFPDGESLVRVGCTPDTAILYRSLDQPNAKLVEILLAAGALRDNGAEKVVLVAPYLAYMRQDVAFHPGEAVSQRVIGCLIAHHFDGLVTVDPHLHRTRSLAEAVPKIPVLAVSAAPALAQALANSGDSPVLVGPDAESWPWVEAIAQPLGLDFLVGEKHRSGDRRVDLVIPGIEAVAGRIVVLVDDVVSSGATLIAAARLLHDAKAASVEAIATHGLASRDDIARVQAAGVTRIRTTDTINNSAGCIPIAGILAAAMGPAGGFSLTATRLRSA